MKQTKNFEEFFDGLRDICGTFGADLVRIADAHKSPREELAAAVYKKLVIETDAETFSTIYALLMTCDRCPAVHTCGHFADCGGCQDFIEKEIKKADASI